MKLREMFPKPVMFVVVLFLVVFAIFFLERRYQPVQVSSGGVSTTVVLNGVSNVSKDVSTEIMQKKLAYPQAPDFVGIEGWINTEPLHIEDLRGKVVLVDFWTYTCINCIRTLPYLKAWKGQYGSEGFVIVGVHTPEFEFEKKYENVLNAAKEQGLVYPIAQDNAYGTWRAYGNRYWPHEYLIDIDGFVREDHIGEGGYEETEKAIQELLQERRERLQMNEKLNMVTAATNISLGADFSLIHSPEIYLGAMTTRGNFGSSEGLSFGKTITYVLPTKFEKNEVYLQGNWKNNEDNVELVSDSGEGDVVLRYDAKQVNIVASAIGEGGALVDVTVDGVKQPSISVGEEKLYTVVAGEGYGEHVLRMHVKRKGFRLYTFTFG